jgi:DNA polymerase-1
VTFTSGWAVRLAMQPVLNIPRQLIRDGHGDAARGTPAQIWSRDEHDKCELTTEFMFFALLRKGINEELPGWPEVVVVFDGQDGSAQRKRPTRATRPTGPQTIRR